MKSRIRAAIDCNRLCRAQDPRRGVALVIVLGFLAVLTAMAVGFAVTMRVERLSSNVYYHGARTRQFVHLGLARAMDEVDRQIMTDGFYPSQTWYASETGTDVPEPPLISREGTDPQDADAYIPYSVFPPDTNINQGRWIYITDPDNERIGRYAWIAVNCSGLLDGNAIGKFETEIVSSVGSDVEIPLHDPRAIGPGSDLGNPVLMERHFGYDAGEIRIDPELLSEIAGPDTRFFIAQRDWGIPVPRESSMNPGNFTPPWVRFETVAEASYFPELVEDVRHLFTYSLFPSGFLDVGTQQARSAFYIGRRDVRDEDEDSELRADYLSRLGSAIAQGFTAMGHTGADVARNLMYYLGELPEPRELESFATERVPMINEIVITTEIKREDVPGNLRLWSMIMEIETELWYPFWGATTNGQFTLNVEFENALGGTFGGLAAEEASITTARSVWDATETATGNWEILKHRFILPPGAIPPPVPPGASPTMPNELHLRFRLLDPNGVVVDEVETDPPIEWNSHFVLPTHLEDDPALDEPPGVHPPEVTAVRGSRWEAVDPRINWDWASHWKADDDNRQSDDPDSLRNNLGDINEEAREKYQEPGRDGTWHMYVKGEKENLNADDEEDGSELKTVGELGFLLYSADEPWKTVQLSSGTPPVLDYFTMAPEKIRRGLVNINTSDVRVLGSVFRDMPIERWPGDDDAIRVTEAEARSLASAIIINQGDYINLSNISNADLFSAIVVPLPGWNRFWAESLIRNSSGLLSPRQNLFTIVVAAQSMIGNEVMGEARAIAVVWRDPFRTESEPGGNLVNRSFVRFFRWLDE